MFYKKFYSLAYRTFSSSLLRSSGIYTIASFINAAIPMILLPVLTRKLTPADYGIVAMFQLAVSAIYPFIGINFEGAIARKYYDKAEVDFTSYIGTCLIIVFLSSTIFLGIIEAFENYVASITQIPPWCIKYIILVNVSQFIINVILVIFQVKVKPIKYGLFQIVQSILNFGLTILFIVGMNKKWEGRVEAQIISTVSFALLTIIVLIRTRQVKFNFTKANAKHALKYGAPLIPHAIGGMFFTAIDRFFLTNYVGLAQTGNYSVAYQLGAILSLITTAFNNAYVPWLFNNLNKDDLAIKRKIVKFTYLYYLVLIIGAMLLISVFPIVIRIFIGGAFKNIGSYSTFIVLAFVFQGMYFMVTNYIAYSQKTYLQAIVTISVGLLKIPITYFAIVLWGASGASISFFVTFFIFFVATWILSARVYKMPWIAVLKS